ncbi:disease resistance-like protein DSC1 [Neltuma alba]|uniref:disease resistance-like protein DSC1 n=1 Tax=Neltuma alba TaxID=207710 RepID=UPI0010A42629|nr:disease resistance-like protein DSC1 [Prosopis alba]
MTNLRVVKFYSPWHVRSCNVHHPTSFESFSDESGSLEWNGYPFKSLPLNFYPEKLVEHSMPNSHVMKLWRPVQDYVNSKRISLGRSKQSMDLLDFSKAQEIEWEGICFCESFCNVDPHILSLSMTVALNFVRSKYSKTLHSEGNFRSLRNFDVSFCFSVKEFSLSSKEISDLDLLTSNSKILYSSIGSLSELRRIILGGSRLEILPINELCCLRSFEERNLSDCRQMNQSPKLHVLFDALFDLQELFMAGCSDFFEVPDIIGTYSSLKYLGLKGSCIDSLPASIKNLPLLKAIYLRNCRRLLSIPQLPPSIMHLDATNCTSLENIFTITTSAPQQDDILSYFFLFVNCLKLDEHSLCNIMDNAYLSLKRAVLNNLEASVFCYPSNRAPEWFRCNQTRGASMSMQLSPAVDELLGFVFCTVLPQFTPNEICPTYVKCSCCFEDVLYTHCRRG